MHINIHTTLGRLAAGAFKLAPPPHGVASSFSEVAQPIYLFQG